MSSPSPHGGSDESAAVRDAKDADGVNRPSSIRVTVIVQNRYTFDTALVTGRQIKEKASVPPGFALYRRGRGGNPSRRWWPQPGLPVRRHHQLDQ